MDGIFFILWCLNKSTCCVCEGVCAQVCALVCVRVYVVRVTPAVPETDGQWWELGSFRKMSRRKTQKKILLVCRL